MRYYCLCVCVICLTLINWFLVVSLWLSKNITLVLEKDWIIFFSLNPWLLHVLLFFVCVEVWVCGLCVWLLLKINRFIVFTFILFFLCFCICVNMERIFIPVSFTKTNSIYNNCPVWVCVLIYCYLVHSCYRQYFNI